MEFSLGNSINLLLRMIMKDKVLSNSKTASLIFSIIIVISLFVGFSTIYFDDHAWGAWGDDSAGYIFLAGRLLNGDPVVYVDALAAAGLEFFGDEKLARWLTPTHHQFINPTGTIASKYPIGASLLLLAGAKLAGSSDGFYYVTPAFAALNVVLVYILALVVFPKERYRHAIGFLSAFILGVSNLYYDYAIAQPMREIPSITFLLLMAIFIFRGLRSQQNGLRYTMAVLSGIAFGMAFNIRETSVVVLPAVAVYVIWSLWQRELKPVKNIKKITPYIISFFLAVIVAIIPTIENSISISKEKVAFKARDTGSVVLLSNIGHLETLSFHNVFDNPGKFRPGKGALPHYWQIVQNATPMPYFLAFVLIGVVFLWRESVESRQRVTFLVLWSLGVLLLFSLWINPYSRYILPMYPALILLGVYGVFAFFRQFLVQLSLSKPVLTIVGIAVLGTFFLGYQPILAQVQENLQTEVYRFKAISKTDLETLQNIGIQILEREDQPVLLFTGVWQYGTSETLQAHTGLKTIRFPFDQRFEFNQSQVNAFFDQMLEQGYDLYIWVDSTSSADAFAWLEHVEVEEFTSEQFTFEPEVRLYKIHSIYKQQ